LSRKIFELFWVYGEFLVKRLQISTLGDFSMCDYLV